MSALELVSVVIGVGLMAYLVYALFWAERF
jgi:K+-transporting ATPase KdpF subunit